MNVLFVFNGAPYGDERAYNGLRLAGALAKRANVDVRAFLMGDSVLIAKSGQHVPSGYYNTEIMLRAVSACDGRRVAVCGTCMDARGIKEEELSPNVFRGTLGELADWVEWADKVLTF